MVALLLTAPPALAEPGSASGGTGSVPVIGDVGVPAAGTPTSGGSGSAPGPATSAPTTRRPTLTVFDASQATAPASASSALVRFQVRDRARRVRVRLAFVSLAGDGTTRVNLRRRRTGIVHSVRRSLSPGSYRVRIAAVNPRKRRVVRATTVNVAPPATVVPSDGVFPVAGAYSMGGKDGGFGAPRSGHTHQGQDIAAAEGTPVVAPKAGTVHWRAYQAAGAGYYVVLDANGEDFMYVFMHLRKGSVLVSRGDHVAAGQQIAQVGNTGRSFGAHLHFEVWKGVWYGGGKPIDPLPVLRSWEAPS
ncbi:MAG: peptidoglycan DD-metalloendopeptidase family protein [Solirubrobacterales bacterium]